MPKCVVRCCFILASFCLMSAWLWASGFPKMAQYSIGQPGVTATGDFNGDGKTDLSVLSQCSPSPCSNSTIGVLLGNGAGRFQRPILSTTVGLQPISIVAGDFNGDQKQDVAFLTYTSLQPLTTSVAVALGNGNGTFGAATVYPLASYAVRLLTGDVNGDSKSDLLIFLTEHWQLQVLLGSGDGTFQVLPEAPGAYGQCVLADVNHDSKLDVVGASIQLGNGDGTFQDLESIPGLENCPVVADFNGDGNLDLAQQSQNGAAPSYYSQNGVNLYFGNGDGTFQSPVFRWIGPSGQLGFSYLSTADFNGDSKPDLVLGRGEELVILLNTGSAKFRQPTGYLKLGGLLLADLNRDQRTDMIFLRRTASGNGVAVPALAGPDGTFSLPRSYVLANGTGAASIATGDVNGDGNLDLVELNWESVGWRGGHLNRLVGNGDGTFKPLFTDLYTGGKNSYFGLLSDLNRDGKLDVVVVSFDSINVWLGLGNGNFQNVANYPIQEPWAVAAVTDFDGDEIPDLAVSSRLW